MKKFSISFSELVHYDDFKCEAEDADSAMDIFLSALEEGKVIVKHVDRIVI